MKLRRSLRIAGNMFQRALAAPVVWLDKVFPVFDLVSGERGGYGRGYGFVPRRLFYGWASVLQGDQAIARSPRLVIRPAIWRELFFYFLQTQVEIQVSGFMTRDEDNLLEIKELAIPPHSGSIGHADLDQNACSRWLDALEKAGKDTRLLRCDIHSHGNMPVFFSEDDMDTIREDTVIDWVVNIVGNRRGELLGRLDIFEPIPLSLSLPIFVEPSMEASSKEEIALWREKLKLADSF